MLQQNKIPQSIILSIYQKMEKNVILEKIQNYEKYIYYQKFDPKNHSQLLGS